MRYAIIDTETTGLDPNTAVVLEFAAIIMDDGVEVARYETKIKPTEQELQYAHPKALEVNGYTEEAWENAPTIEQVAPDILALLKGCILVGHNIGFDEGMLKAHFAAYGIKERIPYKKIDTQTLAYEHLTPLGLKSVSLDRIRGFLGWSKKGAHTAMKDVEDTANLFELLWRMTPWQRFVLRLKLRFGWKV
jgi:DNA polymerase III epsilon subunit-like protein